MHVFGLCEEAGEAVSPHYGYMHSLIKLRSKSWFSSTHKTSLPVPEYMQMRKKTKLLMGTCFPPQHKDVIYCGFDYLCDFVLFLSSIKEYLYSVMI